MTIAMTIKPAASRKQVGGWVMFGNRPDTKAWFERWYKTKLYAEDFARRRGWTFQDYTIWR